MKPSAERPERRMSALVKWLFHDERVRFILVGAFNTALGYVLFVAIQLLVGRYTSYYLSLYGSYFIATLAAFVAHRRFTFRVAGTGSALFDFLRFQGVNLLALAVNTVALPLLIELGHLVPILAQAVIVVLTTLISYFGHKFYSFQRPGEESRK